MQIISQEEDPAVGINGFEGVRPKWLLPKRKESLFTFWKKVRFEGGERETDLLVHAHWTNSPFSLVSFLFFSVFFFIFFLFFLLCFSFHSVKILCFSIPLLGQGKSLFIVPAMTKVLPFCSLTAFIWSGRTYRPPEVCATHSCQTEAGFSSPSTVALLSCHGINAFSLHFQGIHPTIPPQTCLFWVVCHPSRTYLPKGLGQELQIDLFPSLYHQIIPPLPLTSGPWPHHVLYWLGTGWWCLGLARAFLLDTSKSLPAAYASAVIWRLSVCVSWPFMWTFL